MWLFYIKSMGQVQRKLALITKTYAGQWKHSWHLLERVPGASTLWELAKICHFTFSRFISHATQSSICHRTVTMIPYTQWVCNNYYLPTKGRLVKLSNELWMNDIFKQVYGRGINLKKENNIKFGCTADFNISSNSSETFVFNGIL